MKKNLFPRKSAHLFAAVFYLLSATLVFADIPPPPKIPSHWQKQTGQQITLTGTAKNAKLGAVILVDREPIYIAGKESWEPELLDQEVRVSGLLKTFTPPVATQDKDGAWSQGVSEPQEFYRMENVTAEKIEIINR